MSARVEAAATELGRIKGLKPRPVDVRQMHSVLAAADAVMAKDDALNRVQEFLDWFDDRSDDIAADFPSGPSLYVADLRSLIAALKGDDA